MTPFLQNFNKIGVHLAIGPVRNTYSDMTDLSRFLEAQSRNYEDALTELRQGRKRTHWMWYVFPQLEELGRSATAKFYGISDAAEAKAYLQDPVLGARLIEITQVALTHPHKTLNEIFGSPDDVKFVSCMTLFEAVAQEQQTIFTHALGVFNEGRRDTQTLDLLG